MLVKTGTKQRMLASVNGNESFKGALSAILNDIEGVEVTSALKGMKTNLHIITHVIIKQYYN